MWYLLLPKQVLTFSVREVHRFNLYQDTEAETKRFAKWVDKLPKNTIVGCCITDTAMAKTRPLNSTVYESFRKLGAPDSLTLIGYREPFCFLGWKGAARAKGVYALDAKKQSKQLLRVGRRRHVRQGRAGHDLEVVPGQAARAAPGREEEAHGGVRARRRDSSPIHHLLHTPCPRPSSAPGRGA